MKKLLALALTMMMAFTLAACSNNNKRQLDTENKNIIVGVIGTSLFMSEVTKLIVARENGVRVILNG